MTGQKTRSGILLMEIILVILFFAICAAVCTSVYTKARVTADHSRDLTSAAVRAADMAEAYKAAEGNLDRTKDLLEGTAGLLGAEKTAEDTLTAEYDGMSVELCAPDGHTARITAEADAPSYSDSERVIFQMETAV